MFSEVVANFLSQYLGVVPYLVIAFGLFLGGPALFVFALHKIAIKDQKTTGRDGLIMGIAVATWASLCWLVVPYCGGYPCLPGLLATMFIFQLPPIDTLPEELLVHAVNFILWPLVGWAVFHLDASIKA